MIKQLNDNELEMISGGANSMMEFEVRYTNPEGGDEFAQYLGQYPANGNGYNQARNDGKEWCANNNKHFVSIKNVKFSAWDFNLNRSN